MTRREFEIVEKLISAAWERDEKTVATLLYLLKEAMDSTPALSPAAGRNEQ